MMNDQNLPDRKSKFFLIFASGLHRSGSCELRNMPDKSEIQPPCTGFGVLTTSPSSPLLQTSAEQLQTSGQGTAPPSQEGAGGYLTSIHCYRKCLLELALGKVTSPESWKLSSVKSCNWKVHALILECLTHLQPQYHLPQEAFLESPPAPQYSSLSYNCDLMPTMCPSLDVRPCRGDSNWKKRQHWVSFLFSRLSA